MAVILDPQSWSAAQFSDCILGDARRNQRLMKLATQMAARPTAALRTRLKPGEIAKQHTVSLTRRM